MTSGIIPRQIAYLAPVILTRRQGEYYTDSYVPVQLTRLGGSFPSIAMVAAFRQENGSVPEGQFKFDGVHPRIVGLKTEQAGLAGRTIGFPRLVRDLFQVFQREARSWSGMIIYESQPLAQAAFLVCKLFRVPTFVWLSGFSLHASLQGLRHSNLNWPVRKAHEVAAYESYAGLRLMMPRADGLIACGSELTRKWSRTNSNIFTIAATAIRGSDIEEELPEERMRKHSGTVRILNVGRVNPVKGLEFFIDAISSLRAQDIRIECQIVGPNDAPAYAEALERRAAQLGVRDTVEFVGAVSPGPALNEYYRQADVFVLPSLTEGSPKVLPEALARGLPVVASDVGGVGDMIKEGHNGHLVPPGDSVALAKALSQLIVDPKERYRMGKESARRAHDFTSEAQYGALGRWLVERIESRNRPVRESDSFSAASR